MIEELLKAKKITPEHYELYMLFQANELGRKVLDRMTHHYFMEEPQDMEYSGEGFAFYDGRRSVLREIHRAIINIHKLIKEEQ
jgi:hypothetical protein